MKTIFFALFITLFLYGCSTKETPNTIQNAVLDDSVVDILINGCESGTNIKSCSSIGAMYQHGIKFDKDLAKAIEYFQKGCEKDNPDSCVRLANFYLLGVYVDINREKAFEIYQKACDLGDSNTCVLLKEHEK